MRVAAPGKQTEKGERRRAQLVAAAADLLAEGGFEAIRHRAVAERAGVPLAATTYYFSSLEDLVGAGLEKLGREELAAVRASLDAGEDPEGVVLDLILGPRSRTEGLDAVQRRFERLIGSGRRPFLAGLLRGQRVDFDALLDEALARMVGRVPDAGEVRRVTALVDGVVINALIEADPDPRGIAREALRDALTVV
ncbi:TetR/AcrR family transcriptional regulator [Pseudonocardia sp. HH130630-07]|uniref:TetR/AcrR family transcriptional regulator n=1 Tax=Pseudonocardia sp. HH130630-07 TaxID=1690815 RepID=UPI000814B560|nr:TetR family transcriptional regulator [Pseudonocardia sp. HH130630-07]ANY06438.1 TetR family transcriptional regulator [Pseudonocardia sp. HH130630-07]